MKANRDISIPVNDATRKVLHILEEEGLEAWMVGGCVRDALLGRPVNDVDIACSGLWQQTQAAIEAAGCLAFETGVAHGTLTALVEGETFEVTTYRVDGSYSDGRHPDSVSPARFIEEDLARRDFTVNALAYHPERGLFDPFGGRADLEAGVLRAVGDPKLRFAEDELRVLRGARFASQLGFAIEPETLKAMRAQCGLPETGLPDTAAADAGLHHVAAERIALELTGLLCGDYVHDALMRYADVIFTVLPELRPLWKFDQHTKYHVYDVWEHTAWVVQRTRPTPRLRWAALLHDCGKPDAFFMKDGVGHFYGHAQLSEPIAHEVLRRLKMPKKFSREVCLLVREHDTVVPARPKQVKRMLRTLEGRQDLFRDLCNLKRADSMAHSPEHQTGIGFAADMEECLEQVLAEGQAFSLKQLAVKGGDIAALGIPAGPEVGRILNELLEAVLEERIPNEREALLQEASRLR